MHDTLIPTLAEALSHHSFDRIVIAYSGGMDSSCLLHAVKQLYKQTPSIQKPLLAIHVHHGLSENADAWLTHCQTTCDANNIEFIAEYVKLDNVAGSLEQAARDARYQAFEKYLKSNDLLLMAHHQNDQVETFMMRLMRGSGLTGLGAMKATRAFSHGSILRPWLSISRKQIEAYQAEFSVEHIHDESNDQSQFDRNWWRNNMLPELFKRYPQGAQSILKSIEVLQAEHSVLKELLEDIYSSLVDNSHRLDCKLLNKQRSNVQSQLIRIWLEKQNYYPLLNQAQIQTVIEDVVGAKEDAEPIYRWQDNEIRRYANRLYLMKALHQDAALQGADKIHSVLFNGEPVKFAGGLVTIDDNTDGVIGLKPGEYQLIPYKGSLTAKPFKRASKPLKKWFQEYAIPPWQRSAWPVLMSHGNVVAVPGLFVCEGYQVERGTGLEGWALNFTP